MQAIQNAMGRALERRRQAIADEVAYRTLMIETVAKTLCKHRKGRHCTCAPSCFGKLVYRKDAEIIVAGLQLAGFVPKLPPDPPAWEHDLATALRKIRDAFQRKILP